jgi:hypothetical protein
VAFPLPAPQLAKATLQMSPATIANIGDDHVDAFANGSVLSRRDLSDIVTSVNKVWCGATGGGSEAGYDEAKARFDQLMTKAAETVFGLGRITLQNELCNVEGGLCDFVIDASITIPGWLLAKDFHEFSEKAFDAIRMHCGADIGGSVELIADAPMSSGEVFGMPTCSADGKMVFKVADFQAELFEHDGGATCPANPPPTDICEISSFN